MREQKSLDFSAARATTPDRFQVVALHWKAAVEGGTAHLTILTCRWSASNGRHFFSPTVRFIGLPMNPDVFGQTMPSTLTFVYPYGKRSRIAAVYTEPSTHIPGLIRVKVVTQPLTVSF